MNSIDTLTITIARGRWSVSRAMDLDLITGERDAVTRTELLNDLFDETNFEFAAACRHLDKFALPVEKPVPQKIQTTFPCPDCRRPMLKTALDSWCCYGCGVVWSFAKSTPVKQSHDPHP